MERANSLTGLQGQVKRPRNSSKKDIQQTLEVRGRQSGDGFSPANSASWSSMDAAMQLMQWDNCVRDTPHSPSPPLPPLRMHPFTPLPTHPTAWNSASKPFWRKNASQFSQLQQKGELCENKSVKHLIRMTYELPFLLSHSYCQKTVVRIFAP